jgi:hypothetical protein
LLSSLTFQANLLQRFLASVGLPWGDESFDDEIVTFGAPVYPEDACK